MFPADLKQMMVRNVAHNIASHKVLVSDLQQAFQKLDPTMSGWAINEPHTTSLTDRVGSNALRPDL